MTLKIPRPASSSRMPVAEGFARHAGSGTEGRSRKLRCRPTITFTLSEATEHPEKALHSAEILGASSPLPPATWSTCLATSTFGWVNIARAAQAFAASLAVDERYMREQHVEPDNNWNYVHNLMYSVANLLELGRFDEATRLSARITGARGKLETTLYINAARDSISRLDPRLPVAYERPISSRSSSW